MAMPASLLCSKVLLLALVCTTHGARHLRQDVGPAQPVSLIDGPPDGGRPGPDGPRGMPYQPNQDSNNWSNNGGGGGGWGGGGGQDNSGNWNGGGSGNGGGWSNNGGGGGTNNWAGNNGGGAGWGGGSAQVIHVLSLYTKSI